MVASSTLKFLKDLSKNNNKPWFDANRKAYDSAKENFQELIETVIAGVSKFDPDIKDLSVKDTIFRQNRDVRFSKDKRPYKTNFGASLSRGGKKSTFAGYYFHLEPGGKSFAAGGIWMPEAAELKKIRQEIDYNLDEFKKIVTSKNFKAEFGGLEEAPEYLLVNIPKGYDKDNPAAEYLKFKSVIATRYITDDAELTKPDFAKRIIKSFETVMPLIKFINRAIQ